MIDYARTLGKAYLAARRFGDAAAIYRHISAVEPDNEAALNNYAAASMHAGDSVGTTTTCSRLVGLRPDNLSYKFAFIRALVGTRLEAPADSPA